MHKLKLESKHINIIEEIKMLKILKLHFKPWFFFSFFFLGGGGAKFINL